MTPLQHRALRYIATFIDMRGRSPTIREIAEGLGKKSHSSTHAVVKALEADGYITHAPARACSIQLTTKAVQGDCAMIAMPVPLRARLERQAEREGVSPTSIAHRAIAAYLEGRGI